MKKILIVILLIGYAVFSAPNLTPPEVFMVFPGTYPSATTADWDGDGDNDMLVGLFISGGSDETAGRIMFVENTGSNASPSWVQRDYIKDASGNAITVGGSG